MKRALALVMGLVALSTGCAAESAEGEDVGDGAGAVSKTLALKAKVDAKIDSTLAKRLFDLLNKQPTVTKEEDGDEESVTLSGTLRLVNQTLEELSCTADQKTIACTSKHFVSQKGVFLTEPASRNRSQGANSLGELLYDAITAEAKAQAEDVTKKKLKAAFAVNSRERANVGIGVKDIATLQADDYELRCVVSSAVGFAAAAPTVQCSIAKR